MNNLKVIGIDSAKNFMQLHGADKNGKCVLKKRVARNQFLAYMANLPHCVIGMEACGGSHYWARELQKLGFEVKLMSPHHLRKYYSHHKNDARDAEACAEAVLRKNMRFVSIKTEVQLHIQTLHRVRSHVVKQRTSLMNMIRGLLLEYGIAIAKGRVALVKKLNDLLSDEGSFLFNEQIKALCRITLDNLYALEKQVDHYTQQLEKIAKEDECCQRLATISGIGPLTATALVAKIGNGSEFKKGRELAAFLGLVPKQQSSGDTQQLGGITKHGDRYLRQLLIHGGRACVKSAQRKNRLTGLYVRDDKHSQWIRALAERKGVNKASVAVANKNARMVIALLKNKSVFNVALTH